MIKRVKTLVLVLCMACSFFMAYSFKVNALDSQSITEYRYRDWITKTSTTELDEPWVLYNTTIDYWHQPYSYVYLKQYKVNGTGTGSGYTYSDALQWKLDNSNNYCFHSGLTEVYRYYNKNHISNSSYDIYVTDTESVDYSIYAYSGETYWRIQYCRGKTPYNIYHYYQWSEWSDWSAEPVTSSDTREVETRVIYGSYTVSYNANGGTEAPESQTKEHSVNIILSNVIPTRQGYTFKGWSTSSAGVVEYTSGSVYSKNEDVILFAVWEKDNYSTSDELDSGKCGDNVSWIMYEDGTLYIYGSGEMYSWYNSNDDTIPWYKYLHKIKSIIIADGVESIGGYAFYRSTAESVVLGNTIKRIGQYAFQQTNLQYINIPASVERIDPGAFYYIDSLTDVYFNGSVTIESGAFGLCQLLENIYTPSVEDWLQMEYYGSDGNPLVYADNLYIDGKIATEIIVSQKITKIPKYAFYNYEKLKKIVLHNDIEFIGTHAFYNCTGLEVVSVPDVKSWCEIEFENGSASPLYYDAGLYINNVLVTSITIPSEIKNIKPETFFRYEQLNKVQLHEGIISIGDNAFVGCTNLTELVIPEGIKNIGDSAFYGSGLISCVIADSVTNIGSSAFYNCGDLTIYAKAYAKPEGWASDWNCSNYPVVWGYGKIKVTGASLDKTSATLTSVGETLQLTATVTPTDAYDKSVTWVSSDTAVATVDANGLVTAVSNGSCTITATTVDGGFTATCTVTVQIKDPNEDIYTYMVSNGEATITGTKTELSGDIVLPAVIGGYPITRIENKAFSDCDGIIRMTIPIGITTIGKYAFEYCDKLTEVILSDTIISIEKSAFHNCAKLCNINIPDNVESIGELAFYGCGLKSISIGRGVKSIGDNAFEDVYDISEVCIKDLTVWCEIDFGNSRSNPLQEANNFYINGELSTEIIIPEGVTQIKSYAFYGYTQLKSVIIPDSVVSIGGYSFNYSSLENIDIGKNVLTIGNGAFAECPFLKNVDIPDSVISIGEEAFYNCNSLYVVKVGKNVSSIGTNAFYDSLIQPSRTVYISDIIKWCAIDFANRNANPLNYKGKLVLNNSVISSVEILGENIEVRNYAFYGCSSITKVILLDGVTTVGKYTFCNCANLINVVITDNVTNIGSFAFYNCGDLTIYAKAYAKPEGWASDWNCSNYPVVWGYGKIKVTGVSIDKTSATLTSVSETLQLTAAVTPADASDKSVTWTSSNTAVAMVDANGKVTAVASGTATINATTTDGSFTAECEITVQIPSASDESMYTYTVTDGKATITKVDTAISGDVTIPSTLGGYPITSIGTDAFYNCSNLTGITISDNVTSIGSYAFAWCRSLTRITIPDSVISIGGYAFYNCRSLTSVTILDSVTDIGDCAFDNCSSLTNITVSAGNIAYKDIDGVLFTIDGTTLIQYPAKKTGANYMISDDVTKIGNFAFEHCINLVSVIIPDSIMSMGTSVFDGCANLTIYAEAASRPTGWSSTWNYDNRPVVWGYGKVTGVTLDKTSATLTTRGETLQLTATVTPDHAYDKSVTWTSSNPTIATVDTNGLVTAVANGTATITATTVDGGFMESCTVIVKTELKEGLYTYTVIDGKARIRSVDYSIAGKVIVPSTLGGYPVTEIGSYAFSNCRDITSLSIPDSITLIDYYAFESCVGITEIKIGKNVENIEYGSFRKCSGLEEVNIPNGVKHIGVGVFNGCSSLKKIFIPSSVTNVDYDVFMNCNKLTIYAETVYKPSGWHSDWNFQNRPVVWGYVQNVGETVTGYSVTLQGTGGGDIGINLKMTLTDELLADGDAYIKVSVNGKESKVSLNELKYDEETGKYSLKTAVAAKNMNDIISATVYNGDGGCGKTYNYSITGYCRQILTDYAEVYPKLVPMMNAMLNYGAYAQVYFGYNTENLSNSFLGEEDRTAVEAVKFIDGVPLATYVGTYEKVGLANHSASIVLNTETKIKHYITIAEGGNITDYQFKVGEMLVMPEYDDGRYCITIDKIAAKNLDEGFTLMVIKGATTYAATYSAMNYVEAMFNACKDKAEYTDLCNLLKAIYLYNDAANTYFGK